MTANGAGKNQASAVPTGLVRLALIAALSGALTGIVGAVFRLALIEADTLRDVVITWAGQWPAFGWLAPVALAAVLAAVVQWMVQRYAPLAAGSGAPHVAAVMEGKAAPAPLAILPVTFFGGILAIGSGLAVGREGITGKMGASIGALLASWANLDADRVNAIQGASFGAGLGVAFNAPLSGLAYVFEGLTRRFTTDLMVAALASSAAALLVMRTLMGNAVEFQAGQIAPPSTATVAACLALGVLIGALGAAYNWATVFWLNSVAAFDRVPEAMRAAVIGGVVGLVAWFEPSVVGDGNPIVRSVLANQLSISLLALVLVSRWLLGPFSYAAGSPGGLFAPTLVVGAVTGSFFAGLINLAVPALGLDPVTCAIVGMAAFVAAVIRTPLTGIAMVLGTTGTVTPLVPMLIACLGATITPYLLNNPPIFETLSARAAALTPLPPLSRTVSGEPGERPACGGVAEG